MNFKIEKTEGFQCIDSRGFPTVMAKVTLKNGITGTAMVPSGASTGSFEAVELRDNDKKIFFGKSVRKAISGINNIISEKIRNIDCGDISKIDGVMIEADGTQNKANLGANAILAVSEACCRAAATAENKQLFEFLKTEKGYNLPTPMMNIINGGMHASNNIEIQEFMVVPFGMKTFAEKLRCGCEIYHELKNILTEDLHSVSVGDEGGFAPNLEHDDEALRLILRAAKNTGYSASDDIFLAVDAAVSEWYRDGIYVKSKSEQRLTKEELIDYFVSLTEKFPIKSIEDGIFENDFDGFRELTLKLKNKVMTVGDDLFATNLQRLIRGIEKKSASAILIKPNQIGTVTETISAIKTAQDAGMKVIVSHRSGDTEDSFIADFAVATGADFIKSGAPCRAERTAKYNRLLEIENLLKTR